MNQPVLIVVEKGVADVRYCPPGVVVFIKDYDVQCSVGDGQCSPVHRTECLEDGQLDHYHVAIATNSDAKGAAAYREAKRLMRGEGVR